MADNWSDWNFVQPRRARMSGSNCIGNQYLASWGGTANKDIKTPSACGSTTWTSGNSGDAVERIQAALNGWWPHMVQPPSVTWPKLVVDGTYGNKTKERVRDFQSQNGLSVDGLVGRNTWNKLRNWV